MAKNYEAITCKAAIYTPDGKKVLVVEYTNNEGYGLPGGHLEKGEEPAMACAREIHEEIGIKLSPNSLVLKNSWRHINGKIILGYVSKISDDVPINSIDTKEIKAVHWVGVAEIKQELIPVGTYRQFIIANWPQSDA